MNYLKLLTKIEEYKNKYIVKEIGESLFCRKIFAVEIIKDKSYPFACIVASTHAREHITTDLVCKMLDDGLFDKPAEFNISIILMHNPDGVELATYGISSASQDYFEMLLKANQGSFDFSLWKANGRGVDLNNNFNAKFNENVKASVPSASGFRGAFAESEPETQAVINYLKQLELFFVLSYHSKGEEIYFNFFQESKELERDRLIAENFSNSTGYVIKNPENSSSGGLKDYVVQEFKIPSLTIEIGSDKLSHPIFSGHLKEIYHKNKNIMQDIIFAYKIYKNYQG